MITVRQSILANSDSLVTLLRGSSLKNINIYWTFKKNSQRFSTLKFDDLNTETHLTSPIRRTMLIVALGHRTSGTELVAEEMMGDGIGGN